MAHPFGERASATLIYIALLAIMVVLMVANVHTIQRLGREEKFMERQQVHRLNLSQTNALAAQPGGSQ